MSQVYAMPVIAILREKCSELSLMELRERVLLICEAITDLSLFHTDLLAIGTPAHQILPGALLDILYNGSSYRPGIVCF